jgi:hypothetical protein
MREHLQQQLGFVYQILQSSFGTAFGEFENL